MPYSGPHPYIVRSLDGTPNDALSDFAPTAASAALLERFMNVKEGAEVATEHLLNALKLAGDVSFRRKADEVKAKMASLPSVSEEYKAMTEQFDALVASIVNADLRPT